MSKYPVNDITGSLHAHDEREPACVPPANRVFDDSEIALLRSRRRPMRVKLCSACPYTPRDLARHYDPAAAFHVCATCDAQREASTNYHPRKIHRRQQCKTFANIPGTAQPSGARSATKNSVSYNTTPGEPPSARRNALIASGHARKVIAHGCVDFTPPDNDRGEAPVKFFPKFEIPERRVADTASCSTSGGGT
jgi:hypothetical protein